MPNIMLWSIQCIHNNVVNAISKFFVKNPTVHKYAVILTLGDVFASPLYDLLKLHGVI